MQDRSECGNREKTATTMMTNIKAMERDLNGDNIKIHEVLTGLLMETLEREYDFYVKGEGLDIPEDPNTSYLKWHRRKLANYPRHRNF